MLDETGDGFPNPSRDCTVTAGLQVPAVTEWDGVVKERSLGM